MEQKGNKDDKSQSQEELLKCTSLQFKSEIPVHASNEQVWHRISLFQLIYSLTGLLLGLVSIIGGMILFLNGVSGSTRWIAKFVGGESTISDAAPGAVLFIVGLFIVWITKFNLKVKK